MSSEQDVCEYSFKQSNKRFIIPLQKRMLLLQFYLERVFKKNA